MLVSGPTMIIRLKNKKGHIIYLFGDIHYNLNEQFECPISENSIRIDQLFKNTFKINNKDKLGFFVETSKNNITTYDTLFYKTSTHSYLPLIRAFVSDNLQFNEKNKIIPSKYFPKVMFHYFDIRLDEPSFEYFLNNNNVNLGNLLYSLDELKFKYDQFIEHIKNKKNYYFKKVVQKKYNNPKIQKIINILYEDIVSTNTSIDKIKNKASTYIVQFNKNKLIKTDFTLEQIIFKAKNLHKYKKLYFSTLISMLNDLYLLRRLLDKNYNTKIDYIYAGACHVINITMFLLKYTDYEITHNTCNIDYLKKNISNYNAHWFSKYADLIINNCLGTSTFEFINQCVDITHFPPNLT